MDTTMHLLRNFLDTDNRLTAYPAKRRLKLYALQYLASKLEPARQYTESELNALLGRWHSFDDPATLRRELYNNRFIDREPSGRSYWLEETQPTLE